LYDSINTYSLIEGATSGGGGCQKANDEAHVQSVTNKGKIKNLQEKLNKELIKLIQHNTEYVSLVEQVKVNKKMADSSRKSCDKAIEATKKR
jgi:hypothetical protein